MRVWVWVVGWEGLRGCGGWVAGLTGVDCEVERVRGLGAWVGVCETWPVVLCVCVCVCAQRFQELGQHCPHVRVLILCLSARPTSPLKGNFCFVWRGDAMGVSLFRGSQPCHGGGPL